jgi:hypothetical protein
MSITVSTTCKETDQPLTMLAAEIAAAHQQARAAAQSTLEHARRAGELLIEAKARLPHGSWLPWLAEHCGAVSPRMAQYYMKIASDWDRLASKAKRVSHLPIRQAVRLLRTSTATVSEDSEPDIDVTYADLASLKAHPRNYKQHPEEQLAHLMESIRQFGFLRPVVVARGDVILIGHGIVEAAKRLGKRRVPVKRLDVDPNDPLALRVLTGDNEVGKLAERDARGLTEILRDVLHGDSLLGTGFDEMSLSALVYLSRPTEEIATKNEAAEWVARGMPEFGLGSQLYRLIITFRNAEDRVKFIAQAGVTINRRFSERTRRKGSAWSAWWPPRQVMDRSSVIWVVDESDSDETGV